MANAFITDLENIGKHILSGIKLVSPIVQKIPIVADIPVVGPILSEVATVVTNIETKGASSLTPAEIEQIITTLVAAASLKSAAASSTPVTTVTTVSGGTT